MSDCLEYYKILGVKPQASFDEIKQNYWDLAKIWHPDYNKNDNAADMFQKISRAYSVLEDNKHRLMYDVFCIAYKKQPIPEMTNLKIYKNQKAQMNTSLRVLNLTSVLGFRVKNQKVICSENEAMAVVLKTCLQNWTLGLLNYKTIGAVFHNIKFLNQSEDNIQLLLHNSLAYYNEGKKNEAGIYALQAYSYSNNTDKFIIEKWIRFLGLKIQSLKTNWNFARLRNIQFLPFLIIVIALFFALTSKVITNAELLKFFDKKQEITYFQKVKFKSGLETFDDAVVSKIINYPIDFEDDSKLFYLKEKSNIKYGPSVDFDTMAEVNARTTVRVTGASPDGIWYRVLLDNGEMGFVKREVLKKGVGKDIPLNSKIIK